MATKRKPTAKRRVRMPVHETVMGIDGLVHSSPIAAPRVAPKPQPKEPTPEGKPDTRIQRAMVQCARAVVIAANACAQFHTYAMYHYAKGTYDGVDKARTNAGHAEDMQQCLNHIINAMDNLASPKDTRDEYKEHIDCT